MAYVDILFLVIIGIGLLIGLLTNWWRRLIGLIVFVGLFAAYYFLIHDFAWKWLEYESFGFLHQIGILKDSVISFYVEALDTTFRCENLRDLFLVLQNFNVSSPGILVATCDGLCQSICLLVVVLALLLVSFLVSLLLYWALFRWIMPKAARSGAVGHILGGIVGIIENAVVAVILLVALGNISGVTDSVVAESMKNQNSELAIFFVEKAKLVSFDQLSKYAEYVSLGAGALNPLQEGSYLVRPLFEILTQTGFNPFNIVSVEYVNDAGETIKESFRDSFTTFIRDMVTNGFKKINDVLS